MSLIGQGVIIGGYPALHAPAISRSGNTVTISDPSSNGSYVTKYKIYNGNALLREQTAASFSLTGLGAGTYALSVSACGTDFEDSPKSNVINASVYTIARSLTNLSANNNTPLIADGQTYTVTLTPSSGYYLPESIIVTIGGSSSSDFTYSSLSGVISIPNINGNVSITAVASDQSPAMPIYGVSGLYNSSPALTRTDDAVGMDFAIDSSSGSIDSDFDSVFPWNEAEVVTLDAGKFLRLPDMYFRVGVDSSNRITDIAVSKEAGSIGDWYKVDSFDVACYGASIDGTALKSVSGVSRAANETRATFRQYAVNSGAGYYQYDIYHRVVLQFLWLIEFATKDSGSIMSGRIIGSGTSGGYNTCPTGGTDSLSTPSGFETAYAQMRWHYIEDFVGNIREIFDGIIFVGSGSSSYVTTDPSKFSDSDTSNMSALSYNAPSNGCVAALGWDSDNPFMCTPIETVNNENYNTYFCDLYSITNNYPVAFGGADCVYNGTVFGIFNLQANGNTWKANFAGSRLLHTPS